jgi:hypothetical protein
MATSNSYDFSATATNLITDALVIAGVIRAGQTISSAQESVGLRSLNLMVKAWQGESIGMWLNQEIALFQSKGGFVYDIGPSGDHATASWVKQELASAATSGASTITVDDDDGISDADIIGVELDSGVIDWDVINGTPASNVITLTSTLDGAAAVDNHVYTYTSLTQRPLQLIEVRLVRGDGSEIPLEIVSRAEYMALNDKDATGTPNQVYYDKQLTNGKLYVWQACGNVKEYIKFTGKYPVEDFDAAANTADFPQEWFEAITYNLAIRLAPQFDRKIDTATLLLAIQLKDIASGFDREETSVYFDIGD